MENISVKCVIFNYNLGKEADKIYEKLLNDGFNSQDLILVDNGSDEGLEADNTNFSLPWNCRFSGQSSLTLRYLNTYFPSDFYFLITTSATLDLELNYFEKVKIIIEKLGADFGFVASSLHGGKTNLSAPKQDKDNITVEFVDIYEYQPIMLILSNKLVTKCIELEAAYFNIELKRGWGIDRELKYVADLFGYRALVSKEMYVEWSTNLTHVKGVADESQIDYWNNADLEMNQTFRIKYGLFWRFLFHTTHKFKNKLNYFRAPVIITGKIANSIFNLFFSSSTTNDRR